MGIKNKLNEAEAEVRFHEQREQRMMRDLDKIENEIMLEKKKTEKVDWKNSKNLQIIQW